LSAVSDQSLISSGVASVRRKLPRFGGERVKLEANCVGGEGVVRQPLHFNVTFAVTAFEQLHKDRDLRWA
jgi:hypothetical protein